MTAYSTRTILRTPARLLGSLLAAGLAAGCVDLKETPISGATDAFYSTVQGFEAAVNASYEPLRNFYAQEMGFTMTVFGTDEFTKGADGSHKQFNDYTTQLNGDESYIRDAWRNYYRAINTANTAIAAIDRAAALPNVSESLRKQRTAEARFLRAFYYFDLVRIWGDVPLQLEETKGPVTTAERAPAAQVYDAIIADLEYAEANLPDAQSQYGRATRPAARHLLAKVYLTRGAPGDYAKAADKAKLVINSRLFQLLPRYGDIFKFDNEKNAEVIWSIQFTPDPLTTGPGNSGHLYFLMAYELQPGMKRDTQNGRAFKRFRPTTWLLNLWDRSKDTRYDDTFNNVWYANNEASIPKDASGKPKFALGDTAVWMPGVEVSSALRAATRYKIIAPSEYTDAAFPSLKKFHDPNRLTVNETRGSRDFLIFRLAETYLIAAEALVRDGKPAEAVPFLNAVRERAAKPGVAKTDMDITAADVTLDFVLDERARELAGEGMRWFDLTRTGKLVERVKKYNASAGANIKDYHVLRPIPNEQITLTSNTFPQNPGY